ncbi:SHOCT domain-containing protein [Escherichia coli]
MLLTAALVLFLFVYKAGMFRGGGDYFPLVFVFILLYVYHLAFHKLWLRTIDENSSIIIENGIFNFNRKNASVGFSRKDVNNIDTLLKLNEARKEGIISEDEFNKLKKRLNILND